MDAIEHGPGMRLVAVADREFERADGIAAGRKPKPTAYQDYHDLLTDPAVDVVVVCLPSQLHAEATVAAANAGKHIYCEKVMASTVNEARAMIRAADANGVKLMIGHSTRYHSAYMQARRLIEAGEIGEVIAVDGAFPTRADLPGSVRPTFWGIKAGARGHGVVMNFGCHYADTARYLCGEEFAQVGAYITNRFSQGQAPEDQFVVTAVCASQAIVTIGQYGQVDYVPSRNTGFTIYGSAGTLEAFYQPDAVAVKRAGDDTYTQVAFDEDIVAEGPWERLHRGLRQAIEDDTEPSVTGTDGLRNIEWALGAYLANERREWMDLPLAEQYWDYAGPTREHSLPIARGWEHGDA